MHICTLICLREGDSIIDYDKERAEAYIRDWADEGYSHLDFFGIAGSLSSTFAKDYRQTKARIEETERQLRAVSVTK